MTARWGIRYLVVALGSLEEQASEEDVEAVAQVMRDRLPFTVTVLSPAESDRLTVGLLRERGAL